MRQPTFKLFTRLQRPRVRIEHWWRMLVIRLSSWLHMILSCVCCRMATECIAMHRDIQVYWLDVRSTGTTDGRGRHWSPWRTTTFTISSLNVRWRSSTNWAETWHRYSTEWWTAARASMRGKIFIVLRQHSRGDSSYDCCCWRAGTLVCACTTTNLIVCSWNCWSQLLSHCDSSSSRFHPTLSREFWNRTANEI